MKDHMPAYQQPLFLRVQPEMEVTTTFKHRKVDMVKQAFDPRLVPANEPLFFRDDSAKTFVPLDQKLFDKITDGSVRV